MPGSFHLNGHTSWCSIKRSNQTEWVTNCSCSVILHWLMYPFDFYRSSIVVDGHNNNLLLWYGIHVTVNNLGVLYKMLSAIQAFVNFVLFSVDHFWVLQNRASCKTFLVKMSFMCMGIKNYSHLNGCAFTSSLALKQRLGVTRKWPFYYLRGSAHCSLQLSWSNKNAVIMYVRII